MSKEKEGKTKGQAVRKVDPIHALSPFDEMERFFDQAFPRTWMRPGWDWPGLGRLSDMLEARSPKVDVLDRDTEVVVRAEVPGVQKDDLDVTLTDSAVTIKGSTKHEKKEDDGDFHRREISRGSFSRTVALPSAVDGEQAKASFKDGVLELVIPKVERSQRKSVKID